MKIAVFGVITPTSVPVSEVARGIEDAGLDGLFIGEHFHLPVGSQAVYTEELPELYKHVPDPFLLLSAAATVTERITLGTSISLAPIHDPLVLATRIGTLDMLSGGRFVYGMGVGWNRPELANHGVDFGSRRERLREQIAALKALWSTTSTTAFEGRFVRFTECWQGPKPVQVPHPPLLFGAGAGPVNFALVADCCDGWMPTSQKQDNLAADLAQLARAVERAGRDPGQLQNMMLLYENGVFDSPPEEYARSVTPQLLSHYADLGFPWLAVGVPFFGHDHFHAALEHLRSTVEMWRGA